MGRRFVQLGPVVPVYDGRLGARVGEAVGDSVGTEQGGEGKRHGAQLPEGEMGQVDLHRLRSDDGYPVACSDPSPGQATGKP